MKLFFSHIIIMNINRGKVFNLIFHTRHRRRRRLHTQK